MKRKLSFSIPFGVQPKQGDRAVRAGNYIHHHPDPKVTENANYLAALMSPYRPAPPLDGPIRATYWFYFVPPASVSKKRLTACPYKETGADIDNLAKQLSDVLERGGFIRNDSRICWLEMRKVYSDSPGVKIWLEEML
jgi:Holliday junction resolvase RusA-like endonuclease